jgi:hypothetical protein
MFGRLQGPEYKNIINQIWTNSKNSVETQAWNVGF